jgi:hypothetical protein
MWAGPTEFRSVRRFEPEPKTGQLWALADSLIRKLRLALANRHKARAPLPETPAEQIFPPDDCLIGGVPIGW